MLKYITLFISLLSPSLLANEKINGTYLGEIEDKYKNTYAVISSLTTSDGVTVKGQYEYKYGGKNWYGIFYDGTLSGKDLLILLNILFHTLQFFCSCLVSDFCLILGICRISL